jgi:hypothetical protein
MNAQYFWSQTEKNTHPSEMKILYIQANYRTHIEAKLHKIIYLHSTVRKTYCLKQDCGSGSELDTDSITFVDPDSYSESVTGARSNNLRKKYFLAIVFFICTTKWCEVVRITTIFHFLFIFLKLGKKLVF